MSSVGKDPRLLVVHPAVWDRLTAWLDAQGVDVLRVPAAGGDLETYTLSPKDPAARPDPRRDADAAELAWLRAMKTRAGEVAEDAAHAQESSVARYILGEADS